MEEKHTILETIALAFSKFVGAVKRNGIAISTYCCLLLIFLYSVIINPINIENVINTMQKNSEVAHTASVDKRLLADQLIPPILENIRYKYNVDRVCILELHNSTENINKVSFLYMSVVYENFDYSNDSIDFISDSYQKQRTSEYYEIFNELDEKGFMYFENLTEYQGDVNARLIRKVIKNGAQSMLLVPLINKGRIDGIIVLTSRKPSMDAQTITKSIDGDVEKIKTLIF